MQFKQKLAYVSLVGVLVIIIFTLALRVYAIEQNKKERLFLDAMTVEEFRKCGLFKLSDTELDALDTWISNTFTAVISYLSSQTPSSPTVQEANAEVTLYDIQGNPVAYMSYLAAEGELTIYLWSGKPVAYMSNSSIYGFNGKHLGWFQDGVIYDHKGNMAGTTKEKSLAEVIRKQLETLEADKRFLQNELSRANVPQPQTPKFIPPGTTDFASNAFLGILLGIKSKAQENRRLQLEADVRKNAELLVATEQKIAELHNLLGYFSIKPSPAKGIKQLKSLKAIKESEPLKPLFGIKWSDLPLQLFLSQGTK